MMCPGGCFELGQVYVSYHVQRGDTLWNLWKKSDMTKQEWVQVNGGRDPEAVLYEGETIVIKDPVETCKQRDNYLLTQELMISGKKDLESLCAYPIFKPLGKFVEKLQK